MFRIIQTFHQTFSSSAIPITFREFSSVLSVVSDSLQTHGLQHARLPCPSLTPGAYSNSCPSIRCCHPTMSSSVIPFSPCLQSFPASGSFPRSQFFTSDGQNIGSFSFSINPSNECLELIVSRIELSFLYKPTLTPNMTTGKTIALIRQTFVSKVMSQAF